MPDLLIGLTALIGPLLIIASMFVLGRWLDRSGRPSRPAANRPVGPAHGPAQLANSTTRISQTPIYDALVAERFRSALTDDDRLADVVNEWERRYPGGHD